MKGRRRGRAVRPASRVRRGTLPLRRPAPLAEAPVRLGINGGEVTRTVEVRRTLVDFLREDLGLTGTHVGCEHGVCGACTVLLDGQPMRSCLLFAVQADGSEITTVEALGSIDALSPLQQAFMDHHALQCGFCTPGFLMSAHALLLDDPHPSREAIREVLGGHLCRCTGYQSIVEAVQAAAGKAVGADPAGPGPARPQRGTA
ncbi:MAG: (2Fe-2S)-binding protein [bacterium]